MVIRLATSADAWAIGRVHVLSWQTGYRGLVSDSLLDNLSIEGRAKFWAGVFAQPRPNQRTFVADFSGDVRGFVTGGRCRDDDSPTSGELQAIYVLPEQWDTGTGSALHKVCIDALRADAFTDATLWMVEGNDRALRFYGKHGWKPDGASKVQQFDGATMHEMRLRRALT
jgi:GNAT superfamily N-acetyltransferase